jgi:PIN domain nuclease of toxin-antitoxin system
MKLLLDTHVVISILDLALDRRFPKLAPILRDWQTYNHVSVASLWEIALKVRLGKLKLKVPLDEMAATLKRQQVTVLMITPEHAVFEMQPEPLTKDPFDRLLLAQAQLEGLRLLTIDRALVDHPVAWR